MHRQPPRRPGKRSSKIADMVEAMKPQPGCFVVKGVGTESDFPKRTVWVVLQTDRGTLSVPLSRQQAGELCGLVERDLSIMDFIERPLPFEEKALAQFQRDRAARLGAGSEDGGGEL